MDYAAVFGQARPSLAIVRAMSAAFSPTITPFLAHLGPHHASAEAGRARLELTMTDWQRNGFGVAHGGVLMTLLDAVMAMAAKSADPEGYWVVTIEMKTSFLRPAKGELVALGFCDHRSTSMSFCRGEIRDPRDRLLAQAMGTYRRMVAKGLNVRASGGSVSGD
jgi:uncharacterized protein (TIGR00369 family)